MVTVWAMTLGMIEVVVNSVDMKMLRNVDVGVSWCKLASLGRLDRTR